LEYVKDLHIFVDLPSPRQVKNLMTVMNTECKFALQCFKTNLDPIPEFSDFYALQPGIVNLSVIALPTLRGDILPSLKTLSTRMAWMSVFEHARNITHLDIGIEDSDALDQVLRVLGHQLISLKLERHWQIGQSSAPPTTMFLKIEAPKLKFLEVGDHEESMGPTRGAIDMANMDSLETMAVETFIWVPGWLDRNYVAFVGGVPYEDRLRHVRRFAARVLEVWPKLREFVYASEQSNYVSCTLDKDGNLVEHANPLLTAWDKV